MFLYVYTTIMTQEQGAENPDDTIKLQPRGILAKKAIAKLLSDGKTLPPHFIVWKETLSDEDKNNPLLDEISLFIKNRTPLQQNHFDLLKEKWLCNRAWCILRGLQISDIPNDSRFDELNDCAITWTTIKNLHVRFINHCTIETEIQYAKIDYILSSTFTTLSHSKCLKIISCTFDRVIRSKIGIWNAWSIYDCKWNSVNNCTLRWISKSKIREIVSNWCFESITDNTANQIIGNKWLYQDDLKWGHITILRIIDNICPEINGNTWFDKVQASTEPTSAYD